MTAIQAEQLRERMLDSDYYLDANLHGPDCVWRFDHKHDACEHEDQCQVDPSAWHTCGSPDHADYEPPEPEYA